MDTVRRIVACSMMALGVGSSSCALPVGAEESPPTLRQIDQMIGQARCSSHSDCRVIGIGASACGGPAGYRAWSVTQTDRVKLEDLVLREAAARRQEMERLGMRSNCRILPVPNVVCQPQPDQTGGRCMLVMPGS